MSSSPRTALPAADVSVISSVDRAEAALPPPLAQLLAEARSAEHRGQRPAAREGYEALLRQLTVAAQAPLAAALARWIARLYDADADGDAAADCLEAALAIAQASGDAAGEAHAVNVMASSHLHRGELDAAAALYGRARAAATAGGDARLVAFVEQNLGVLAMLRGDDAEAEPHFRAALDNFRLLGLHQYVAQTLNNLGLVLADRREYVAAERAYAEAVSVCDAAGGDAATSVMIEVNRAACWIARRDFARALDSCDAASVLAEIAHDDRALAEVTKLRGVMAREQRDFRRAAQAFALARAVADGRRDPFLGAEIAREQATLAWLQRQPRETLRHLARAHRLYTQTRAQRAAADVDRRLAGLEATLVEIATACGDEAEMAERQSPSHCQRVAAYACALAADGGVEPDAMLWFRLGALLHDVGQSEVPDHILDAPRALGRHERLVVQTHPAAAAELLSGVEFPWDMVPMVQHHHERWDGRGYPAALAGTAIPLAARMLAVAEQFDALTSQRPYRGALDAAAALDAMRDDPGSLDPKLLARFAALVARHAEWPLAREAARGAGPAAAPPPGAVGVPAGTPARPARAPA